MAIERVKPAFHFEAERIEQLKQIAPEAFADGKINWETLQEALGTYLEEEDIAAEHFGLFWPGKRAARKIASTPSEGTLIPCPGEGVDEENTRNIFIEGENLEVLKLLQKSYANRIKMIYIDPPYNTGNDFIYEDDFTETIDEYLKRTGQLDEEAKPVSINSKSDGRFHSKWLNMMYPRLRLARNLLRDDGLIFVSIDDNEIYNLRMLMNEVFGEENFVEQICWKNKYGAGAQTRGFISVHEYVLCYSKTLISNLESPLDEEAKKAYNKKDDKYEKRGGYFTQPLMTNSLGDRPNLQYSIYYDGEEIVPNKQWVWSQERLLSAIESNEVVFNKQKDGSYSVRSKQYLKDENGIERKGKPLSVLNGPFTQEGTADIADLFGYNPFGFVKPVKLIEYLFSFVVNEKEDPEGIYLDFFAGSGTTGQAVMKLNNSLGFKRKYICVQMPAEIIEDSNGKRAAKDLKEKNKPTVISELTKERLRLASNQFNEGFKIYKLQKSNFNIWKNYSGSDLNELQKLFESNTTPLVEDWEPQNLLTEILLIEGFPLDSKIEVISDYKKNEVTMVTSNFCEHKLLVCLDKNVYAETIKNLQLDDDDIFICLDSAINDQDKVTLQDKGLIKTI
ncbi:site-specific DNA-methyltransferase [Lacibacter sediminis]|uniref:site-specific DNA-methyltransferase (adenine-specific) n=1 Tax=Lacibacter sediminis TaxID=2760713 RepID=A0A7G5XLW3_9BACT|nr:site-specific DNA-methyltransferase [Lacibacter sediminis]QNA46466.1 site-specific DNA-methyltransferase [Lacibacter sediminis]